AVVAADVAAVLAQAPAEAVLLIDAVLSGPRGALRPPPGRSAVVLLAPEQRDRIPRLKAAGFHGYLIKPMRRASLIAQVLGAATAVRPFGDGPAEPGHPEDERVAPAAAPGAKVLLAEDNPINALLARTLLEREGCRVDRAASGDEAISALETGVYDLILMDLRMPGLNGVDAARTLRERGVVTPIVALTADAFEDDRRACLAAGMNDFLVKPLTPDALRGALTRWIGARWTNAAAQAKVGP
ncbi:MAG: sensor histidine kinase/response regulator, partial [Caulobacter sp.]|nr:sensor histidine kinase/response regulator [Caulobacter sp.]